MLGWLKRRRIRRLAAELAPTDRELNRLIRRHRCLQRLDGNERERLGRLAAEILATKQFHGAGGLRPDRGDCLAVAVHAALPVLNLGLEPYRQFHTFILYRDAFAVEIEETDDDGLVHRGRDLRAGEAWQRGPVVLSLADVADSGHGQGYHVVVHELAHQIDQLNGEADGYPPLPREIEHRDWVETFNLAWSAMLEDLEQGRETTLDPYAGESPAEFLAVACEAFFDTPEHLAEVLPDVYRLLARLFRQDPADQEARVAGSRGRLN